MVAYGFNAADAEIVPSNRGLLVGLGKCRFWAYFVAHATARPVANGRWCSHWHRVSWNCASKGRGATARATAERQTGKEVSQTGALDHGLRALEQTARWPTSRGQSVTGDAIGEKWFIPGASCAKPRVSMPLKSTPTSWALN